MTSQDIAVMAHLLRRAGFGANHKELEAYCAKGYEATVEELLNPENAPDMEYDLLQRYMPEWRDLGDKYPNESFWMYRLISTKRPLEEKIALFWHGVLCTGSNKLENPRQLFIQIEKFRRHGLDKLPTIFLQLASDPAMIFYLDNQMNHNNAINENWGRELLELFSMGVGMDGLPNYTEDDVKECARAFTGWSMHTNTMPEYPYGRYDWRFKYDPADHDGGEKIFLGEKGPWNGEDVIDIICKQPATARFISRHLYNFFVADEPQVPAWQNTPPRDSAAIKVLEDEYFRSGYDIRSMLRVLFNSDFFKTAQFARIKNPAELVAGVVRLAGVFHGGVRPGSVPLVWDSTYMGMSLFEPPTVEGWHYGHEWIDCGTLVERINFGAKYLGNTQLPGIKDIVERLASRGVMSPRDLVEGCLELVGPLAVNEDTLQVLIDIAQRDGEIRNDTGTERIEFTHRVGKMLQMISATPEFQFA